MVPLRERSHEFAVPLTENRSGQDQHVALMVVLFSSSLYSWVVKSTFEVEALVDGEGCVEHVREHDQVVSGSGIGVEGVGCGV